MISDPLLVGTLTDSAMNAISSISGMTNLSALAAPVVVRIILFMMLLFFRKSALPALGSRSKTFWDPVAAWTVAIEADMIFLDPKALISGFIMWARHVVVQDALEMILCRLGS
jgi:hypothetical protein